MVVENKMINILYAGHGNYISRVNLNTFTETHVSVNLSNYIMGLDVDKYDSDNPYIYVVRQGYYSYALNKDDLSIEVGPLLVGSGTNSICVGPDYVYVCSNRIYRRNKSTLGAVSNCSWGSYMWHIYYYNSCIYINDQDNNQLSICDDPDACSHGSTQSYDGYDPYELSVHGNYVVFGGHASNGKVKLCNLDGSLVGQSADLGGSIYGVDFDDDYIYKSDYEGQRIDVVKRSDFTVDHTISIPDSNNPRNLLLDGDIIYVGTGQGRVYKINKSTGTSLGYVALTNAGAVYHLRILQAPETFYENVSDNVLIEDALQLDIGKNINEINTPILDEVSKNIGKNFDENTIALDLLEYTKVIIQYCGIDPRKRIREVMCELRELYGKDTYYINVNDEHGIIHQIPVYLSEETKSDILPSFPFIEIELTEALNEIQDIGGETQKNRIKMMVNIYWTKMDNMSQVKFGKAIADAFYKKIRNYQSNTIGNTWNHKNSFANIKSNRVYIEQYGNQVVFHRVMELDFTCYDNESVEI